MDGTPIFDIKPYIPYADCHPEAAEGFTGQVEMQELTVTIPPEQLSRFPADKRDALIGVLTQDPRPGTKQTPAASMGWNSAAMKSNSALTARRCPSRTS